MVIEGHVMSDSHTQFETIRNRLVDAHEHVANGKMMSSEAITYKKKVFAFFYDDAMCFKLGRNFDLAGYGIEEYSVLSPFKNKAPMLDWIIIPNSVQWDTLAEQALQKMQRDLG